jgi:hypothetical protein
LHGPEGYERASENPSVYRVPISPHVQQQGLSHFLIYLDRFL